MRLGAVHNMMSATKKGEGGGGGREGKSADFRFFLTRGEEGLELDQETWLVPDPIG